MKEAGVTLLIYLFGVTIMVNSFGIIQLTFATILWAFLSPFIAKKLLR